MAAVQLVLLQAAALATATPVASAAASPPLPTQPDVRGDRLVLETAATAAAGLGWLALWAAHPSLNRYESCPCDADDVVSLDRPAVRMHWSRGEALAHVSAALSVAASLAVPLLTHGRARETALRTLLVVQSILVAGLVTQAVKSGVSRPYPYMYRDTSTATQARDPVNYGAFWSGHTAAPMAGAGAAAGVSRNLDADLWPAGVLLLLAPTFAVGSGIAQMLAGNHFPSDVVIGALFGATAGYLNGALRGP